MSPRQGRREEFTRELTNDDVTFHYGIRSAQANSYFLPKYIRS